MPLLPVSTPTASPPTTLRQDTVAAHLAILNAFKAANPALLRHVYPRRPGSFPELPSAYVGARNESITHDQGTRTRALGPSVTLVDAFTDSQEAAARLDILVDALTDWYTANARILGYGVLQQDGATDTEVELTGPSVSTFYPAVVLTFGQTEAQEGRD